ncbi:MAG: hypothetical protein HY817_02560 [Candidatus Abawacabacteria bacterium]|nr:hypothetical protein [Candidatus Abawacabacteria bacterium]
MKFRSFFDKVAWSIVLILSLFIIGMVAGGDFTEPRIQYFNGQKQAIAAQTGQFLFRFNRLMDEKSVESSFRIFPAIKGKFSWSGRTFAFTADAPLHYDEHFTITFIGAHDRAGKVMPAITLQAKTKEQSLLFLDEQGRVQQLVLAANTVKSLTPEHLFVQQFSVSPLGTHLALLATTSKDNSTDRSEFRLYIYDLNAGNLQLVNNEQGKVLDELQWLPDGSGIGYTFINMSNNTEGIAWYEMASEKVQEIATGKARAYSFYFTPDGNKIVYINSDGALILGDMPEGNGALIATTFTDIVGFNETGDYFAYIAPQSVNAFDLTNQPILVNAEGNEKEIPLPESTNFDMMFVPQTKKIVWTQEISLGKERRDKIVAFDYEKNTFQVVIDREDCAAFHPTPNPDGSLLAWQCVENDNKGYVLTGWNDYQGKIVTGKLWLKDFISGEEKDLHIQGAGMQFLP